MQQHKHWEKYKYIDKCCIQYVQIENIGAVKVTHFDDSTGSTIAVDVTAVPSERQLEELTVDHVSSFTESQLFVYSTDHQFRDCWLLLTHWPSFWRSAQPNSSVIGFTSGTVPCPHRYTFIFPPPAHCCMSVCRGTMIGECSWVPLIASSSSWELFVNTGFLYVLSL